MFLLVAPTSLDFCPNEPNKIVVAFANAKIRIFDVETGQILMTFKGSDDSFGKKKDEDFFL